MDRAIVRYVQWHVHATGTWKPPFGPESDHYTEDEEEKDGVSGHRLTLRFIYVIVGWIRPQMAAGFAPTETFGTTLQTKQFCVRILP